VVLLLRDHREALRKPIGKIIEDRAAAFAAGKSLFAGYDPLEGDNRVVLVLTHVETPADYVDAAARPAVRVCRSMGELLDAIERHMIEALVLIDVGLAAYALPSLLLQAPASQRVRRPKQG
jgi:hypothetical protein